MRKSRKTNECKNITNIKLNEDIIKNTNIKSGLKNIYHDIKSINKFDRVFNSPNNIKTNKKIKQKKKKKKNKNKDNNKKTLSSPRNVLLKAEKVVNDIEHMLFINKRNIITNNNFN